MWIKNWIEETAKKLPSMMSVYTVTRIIVFVHLIIGWHILLAMGNDPAKNFKWAFYEIMSTLEPILLIFLGILWVVRENDLLFKGLSFWLGGVFATLIWGLLIGKSMVWCVLNMGNAVYVELGLFVYFDWMNRKIPKAVVEAKLKALQSKMRPHFFFNTINGVVMLLHKNPRQAENALLDLADVFRALMKEDHEDGKNSVKYELDIAKKYLSIESMRFRERMIVHWNVEEECKVRKIPALILQPLIENAIVHGIEPCGDGNVWIEVRKENDWLVCSVTNNFNPEKRTSRLHNGLALPNIKQRLNLIYENKALLFSEENEERTLWVTSVQIPWGQTE